MNPLQALASLSGGVSTPVPYVDDVFSAHTYSGNSSAQTHNNGVDMTTSGGMIWTSRRNSGATGKLLQDTVRGLNNFLDTTAITTNLSLSANTVLTGTGYTQNNGYTNLNETGGSYVSWAFKRATKFFDVVTWTGNGFTRTIAHSLGQEVGMILVKRTDLTANWQVYHRSLANSDYAVLNTTSAKLTDSARWNSTTATTSVFSLGADATVNESGINYVAYVFAHNASADGFIQCGNFTLSGGVADVSLGWEPQFLLVASTTDAYNWQIYDHQRGWGVSEYFGLQPNTTSTEGTTSTENYRTPHASGFIFSGSPDSTYIYMAIRRPNKPPTLGTQVYNAIARTGTSATATVTGAGFAPDALLCGTRSVAGGTVFANRLVGSGKELVTSSSAVDRVDAPGITSFNSDGISFGADSTYTSFNWTYTYINHFFKRAPGVFDVVSYTGTGIGQLIGHSLDAAPQMIIIKRRDSSAQWFVYHLYDGTKYLYLNLSDAAASATIVTSTSVSGFAVSGDAGVNASGGTFVAYLFATKTGISYVGSYVGDGSNKTIDCGFAAGARFVMIKAASATGNWLVGDTTRGIVAGNDPSLALNTTTAEDTSLDWLDPHASGFIVNQEGTNNANVNGVTYLVLAYA